jgi:hypothetical protein
MLTPKGFDRLNAIPGLIKATKNPFKKWKLYKEYKKLRRSL